MNEWSDVGVGPNPRTHNQRETLGGRRRREVADAPRRCMAAQRSLPQSLSASCSHCACMRVLRAAALQN